MSKRYLPLSQERGASDLLLLGFFGTVQLTLIFVHIGFGLLQAQNPGTPWPDLLNICRDFSLGEMTNYVLWIIAIASLYVGWTRKRDPLILAATLVFSLALIDDMFQLHERGSHLVMRLDLHLVYGERAFMIGELAIWAVLGALCVVGLALGWRHSRPQARSALVPQAVLFMALIFFAVGVDVIHGLAEDRTLLAGLLGVIEDGGEMIVLTFIAAHAWPTFASASRRVQMEHPSVGDLH